MNTRIVFLFFVIVYLVSIFFSVGKYPANSRLMPLTIAIALSFLIGIQLWKEFKKRKSELGTAASTDQSPRLHLISALWVVSILPAIYLFGFILGIGLFVFLYLKLHKENWVISVGLSLATTLSLYLGFGVLLQIRLFEGLLFSFLS